jgi:hypothetical protein
MNVQSKASKVKFTENILDELYQLLIVENDLDKKKKHSSNWYKVEVQKRLKLKDNPSLRSYEDYIRKIKAELQRVDPLEKPWSIGDSIKFKIPIDFTSEIIRVQKTYRSHLIGIPNNPNPKMKKIYAQTQKELHNWPSIRQARWFTYLYPLVYKIIEEKKPKYLQGDECLGICAMVADQYADRELMSKILGKPTTDTSDLDVLFFHNHDFRLVKGMIMNYMVERKK